MRLEELVEILLTFISVSSRHFGDDPWVNAILILLRLNFKQAAKGMTRAESNYREFCTFASQCLSKSTSTTIKMGGFFAQVQQANDGTGGC